MAVGICPEGVEDYESLDNQPIKIICMIAAGEQQHAKYVKALAAVTDRLRKESVREAILNADSPEKIYEILNP